MAPLFSFIIPLYNTEKYISIAVDSILSQNCDNCEIILINDGSTDSCPEIIDGYAAKHENVKAFHKTNGGTYSGYNMGAEVAEGKYVVFLSSDDRLDPEAVEILTQQAEIYDYDLILMNVATYTCDKEQNIIRPLQHSVMQQPFTIIGKSFIEKHWLDIINYGLVRNPVNAYRRELFQKHRFREDMYGADFLFNIIIADDIHSAACHHKDLYHGFMYPAIRDDKFNVSTGKYNSYEHDMFNLFYTEYKKLFAKWNRLKDAAETIAHIRQAQLSTELYNINSFNNSQLYYEKIATLISYYDDIVAEVCHIRGTRSEVEKAIALSCEEQIAGAELRNLREKDKEPAITRLLPSQVHGIAAIPGKMRDAVIKNNPYHLWADKLSLLKDEKSVAMAEYIPLLETARGQMLTGDYKGAAHSLSETCLYDVQEPERYLVFGKNCVGQGCPHEAGIIYRLGLQTFPGYMRLEQALKELELTP